jgi:hypothetical protein
LAFHGNELLITGRKILLASRAKSKNAISIQNKTIYPWKENKGKFSWKTACSYLTEQMKDNTKEVTFNLETMAPAGAPLSTKENNAPIG